MKRPVPAGDYVRGLRDALALCDARRTVYAFEIAAELRKLVAAEEARAAPLRSSLFEPPDGGSAA